MPKAVSSNPVTMPTVRLDPLVKLWLGLIGVLAVLGLGIVLVTDGLYNPRHFNISKIALSGDAAHVDRAALKQSVVEMIDGNYFSLDTGKIVAALHALPWVEKVKLRRQWPDTLHIKIEEYQPIALWGEKKWLTTTGKLVDLPLPANVALPQLSGPSGRVDDVWPRYQKWSEMFARHGISLRAIDLSRQHLYTLDLQYTTRRANAARGFTMILSEANAEQQLNAFLESRRLALIEFPDLIKRVDLRYPSGFSISHYEPEKLVKTDN